MDFVVDRRLQPWLLEVNAVPSMARQVSHLPPRCAPQQGRHTMSTALHGGFADTYYVQVSNLACLVVGKASVICAKVTQAVPVVQVLSCTEQEGKCSTSSQESAFDRQKGALVAALFRLLLLPAPSGEKGGGGSSPEAAENLGFVPLCAPTPEAVQLSAAHHPARHRALHAGRGARLRLGQGRPALGLT